MDNRYLTYPSLRRDIGFELYEEGKEKLVILSDPQGFADQPIALPVKLYALVQLFDGKRSVNELAEMLTDKNGEKFDKASLIRLIQSLDAIGYLESEAYEEFKNEVRDYLDNPVRPSILAGNCFPKDEEEMGQYIEDILNSSKQEGIAPNAKAVIAPHIDFRIGERAHQVYSNAYKALENSDPDLVVILGTSHYSNSSLFMLTNKDFRTPLGVAETDKELIKELQDRAGDLFVIDDFAHRNEHSVELQIPLLQKKFANKKFKILPALTGSLHHFIAQETLPEAERRYSDFFQILNKIIEEKGLKVVFIASADFSHVGRKFGDDYDAEPILHLIEEDDKQLIDAVENLDYNKFFKLIADTKDNRKVCGFSPIYALLYASNVNKGKLLDYHQWNETEAGSAVSFAGLAFWK